MKRRHFIQILAGALVSTVTPAIALDPRSNRIVLVRKKLHANAKAINVELRGAVIPHSLVVAGNSLWIENIIFTDHEQNSILIPINRNLPPHRAMLLQRPFASDTPLHYVKINFCCLPLARAQTNIIIHADQT